MTEPDDIRREPDGVQLHASGSGWFMPEAEASDDRYIMNIIRRTGCRVVFLSIWRLCI